MQELPKKYEKVHVIRNLLNNKRFYLLYCLLLVVMCPDQFHLSLAQAVQFIEYDSAFEEEDKKQAKALKVTYNLMMRLAN